MFKEIILSEIKPSPVNPRKNFKGDKFDSLVDSIMAQGVLEPILLRPFDGSKMPMKDDRKFEIVAGERRFRAACKAAEQNGGADHATIPAIVRDLDKDQAFEIMTIENLQREDLTELEEARGFKTYLDKKGIEALPDLAEKTSISPAYIRRRVKVLDLPKYILKAWEKGEIVYGHLEQLMRLSDPKDLKETFTDYTRQSDWRHVTVHELKNMIDRKKPSLAKAKFDTEKSGCRDCPSNSTVQKKLWDIDSETALCLDPKCFKGMVNSHLMKHFKKMRTGTNGWRFADSVSYEKRHYFYGVDKIPAACKPCENFITLFEINGTIADRRICIGEKGCLERSQKADQSKTAKKDRTEQTGPRVAWHGSYFRDKFFQQSIPEKIAAIDPADVKIDRLTLYHLLEREPSVLRGIIRAFGLYEQFELKKDLLDDEFSFYIADSRIWQYVSTLDRETVRRMIREATVLHTLSRNNTESIRHQVAAHIGIDLAAEFAMDDEYMAKKTKAELLEIGEKTGVFEDPKAQAFLYEKLLKKRGKFSSCKKSELVQVFLESGVDLKGKVPDEIITVDQ